jgi:hypothetical protein
VVYIALLCGYRRRCDGYDQFDAYSVEHTYSVRCSSGNRRSVARERYSGVGGRFNLLQTEYHPMSFGVALRNAVSLGLGGIISFVTGGADAGVITVSGSLLLEDNVSFLLMEDNTSQILGEG